MAATSGEMANIARELKNLKLHRRKQLNGDSPADRVIIQSVDSVLISEYAFLAQAKLCVQKLFHDAEGFVGTFTYLSNSIGICATHCVLDGSRVSSGTDLKVCGKRLKHMASFPYYDCSFYEVLGSGSLPSLRFGDPLHVEEGTKLILAAYPKLDSISCEDVDEPLAFMNGHVVRAHSDVGFSFGTADYSCFRGCSGGAILDENGLLLGMHLAIEYYEDSTFFELESNERSYPEPYFVVGENTLLSGEDSFCGQSIANGNPADLAKHAASHTADKCAFGCFLPVNVIESKFEFVTGKYKKAKKRRRF